MELQGFTWWRIDQQWPSMFLCPDHGELLLSASTQFHGRRLAGWFLPADLATHQCDVSPGLTREARVRLTKLAAWTAALVKQPQLALDDQLLRYVYLFQAKTHSWVAFDGSLRLAAIRDAFGKAHEGLEQLPGLSFLSEIGNVNGGFLGTLLRQHLGRSYPTKHLFLTAFLFPEPEEFFSQYAMVRELVDADGFPGVFRKLVDSQRQLRDMVSLQGRSVNAAAQELGVPVAQAIRHLRQTEVEYKKRPRVLTASMVEKLTELLRAGTSRSEVAGSLEIRDGLIKDFLAQHPQLRLEWTKAYKERQATAYRKRFLSVLRDNPGVPIKRIRRIPENGFEWLYRNDREWLENNLPGIWRRP